MMGVLDFPSWIFPTLLSPLPTPPAPAPITQNPLLSHHPVNIILAANLNINHDRELKMIVAKTGKIGNVISIECMPRAIPLCCRNEGEPFTAVAIPKHQAALIKEHGKARMPTQSRLLITIEVRHDR